MKFFHLSDLHIGLKLFNRDLKEDQEYILKQIANLAAEHKPDAVVIAGDVYDKAIPSAEAVEVFDRFISELTLAVPDAKIMMISGNHDSAPRLNLFRQILQNQNIHMIGLPPRKAEDYIEQVTMTDEYGEAVFYLLPFVKPSMIRLITDPDNKEGQLSYDEALHRLFAREKIDTEKRNVLVSHQFYLPKGTDAGRIERMDSEIPAVGNIDAVKADVLEVFDYAALGHIHKPMKVGSEVLRYSGTPLACSVSEAGQEKSIIMVEMKEKGDVKTTLLPLVPLRQVKVITGLLEDVLQEACHDYVSVCLTDKDDLDVIDMQDRLREAFPYLLETKREWLRNTEYSDIKPDEEEKDAYELCLAFLNDADEEEMQILRDVINTVTERGQQ